MPELPEVEIARRNLERWALGRTIVRARAIPSRILGGKSPQAFASILKGARFGGLERRGKNLVAALERSRKPDLGLFIHLGMTGKLSLRTSGGEPPRFSRASFDLDDGKTVHYRDMRLFGRLETGPLDAVRARAFEGLGPDPLNDRIDGALLGRRIGVRRAAPIKVVLMDQGVIAGIGNIQAVESLWRAKISPMRKANALTPAELTRLADSIEKAIFDTLAGEDGPEITYVEEPGAPNPFTVYSRGGHPCPRCSRTIRREVVAGRSTFWCEGCQK